VAKPRPLLGPSAGFLAAAYAFAVAMLGTTLPTPLYPTYQQQWGFSDLTITVIFATYAVAVIAALLLFGRLAFAGSPLRLTFWIDLALLIPAAALIWAMPETVPAERERLRPQRLRIPVEVRPVFVRVALAVFAGFAVLGLFTAVVSEFLGQILEVKSHAILGVVVAGVFSSSIVGQTLLQRVAGSKALPFGCVTLAAGMSLVALALIAESLALLIAGGVVAALGQGLSFRAGLTAVNEASPPERRAEVASSFFVVGYLGVSVPVVGVGVLAELASLRVAGLVFAGLVALLALAALYVPGRSTRPTAALAATPAGALPPSRVPRAEVWGHGGRAPAPSANQP
jgi:MFS family permease